MLKSRHNNLYIWFFWTYFRLLQRVYFRKMSFISEVVIPEDQSVLLFQNHFSWWDGYWSYRLSRQVFKRKFHVMMDEENLRKRMFLNHVGVFSVQKNSRDLFNSLTYTSEILKDPKNLVTIYPNGAMLTQHQQTLPFLGGVDRIVKGETSHFTIVMAVFLTDYFGFARPEIRIYLETYSGERTIVALEKAYHEFYHASIAKQTE